MSSTYDFKKGDFFKTKNGSSWGVVCEVKNDDRIVAYCNNCRDQFKILSKSQITKIPDINRSYVTDSKPFLHNNDPDIFDYNSTRNDSPISPISPIIQKKLIIDKVNTADPALIYASYSDSTRVNTPYVYSFPLRSIPEDLYNKIKIQLFPVICHADTHICIHFIDDNRSTIQLSDNLSPSWHSSTASSRISGFHNCKQTKSLLELTDDVSSCWHISIKDIYITQYFHIFINNKATQKRFLLAEQSNDAFTSLLNALCVMPEFRLISLDMASILFAVLYSPSESIIELSFNNHNNTEMPLSVNLSQPFIRPVSSYTLLRYMECKSIMYVREDVANVSKHEYNTQREFPYIAEKWGLEDELEHINLFLYCGGNVIIQPDEQAREFGYDITPLYINKDDIIFPICHEGTNRSQTLYECCLSISRAFGLLSNQLPMPPHGVFSGFDPFNINEPVTLNNYYTYLHSTFLSSHFMSETGDTLSKSFRDAFGEEKCFRVGEYIGHDIDLNPNKDFTNLSIIEKNRQYMRVYFDNCIYKVQESSRTGKIFVLCFAKSFSVVMNRFLEMNIDRVNNKDRSVFQNIVLVWLPFPDVVGHSGTVAEMQQWSDYITTWNEEYMKKNQTDLNSSESSSLSTSINRFSIGEEFEENQGVNTDSADSSKTEYVIYLNNNKHYPCVIDIHLIQSHNYCLLFKDYCSMFRLCIDNTISNNNNNIYPLETAWDYSYLPTKHISSYFNDSYFTKESFSSKYVLYTNKFDGLRYLSCSHSARNNYVTLKNHIYHNKVYLYLKQYNLLPEFPLVHIEYKYINSDTVNRLEDITAIVKQENAKDFTNRNVIFTYFYGPIKEDVCLQQYEVARKEVEQITDFTQFFSMFIPLYKQLYLYHTHGIILNHYNREHSVFVNHIPLIIDFTHSIVDSYSIPSTYYNLMFRYRIAPPLEYENVIKNGIPSLPTSLIDLYYIALLVFDLHYHQISNTDKLTYDYLKKYIQNKEELEFMNQLISFSNESKRLNASEILFIPHPLISISTPINIPTPFHYSHYPPTFSADIHCLINEFMKSSDDEHGNTELSLHEEEEEEEKEGNKKDTIQTKDTTILPQVEQGVSISTSEVPVHKNSLDLSSRHSSMSISHRLSFELDNDAINALITEIPLDDIELIDTVNILNLDTVEDTKKEQTEIVNTTIESNTIINSKDKDDLSVSKQLEQLEQPEQLEQLEQPNTIQSDTQLSTVTIDNKQNENHINQPDINIINESIEHEHDTKDSTQIILDQKQEEINKETSNTSIQDMNIQTIKESNETIINPSIDVNTKECNETRKESINENNLLQETSSSTSLPSDIELTNNSTMSSLLNTVSLSTKTMEYLPEIDTHQLPMINMNSESPIASPTESRSPRVANVRKAINKTILMSSTSNLFGNGISSIKPADLIIPSIPEDVMNENNTNTNNTHNLLSPSLRSHIQSSSLPKSNPSNLSTYELPPHIITSTPDANASLYHQPVRMSIASPAGRITPYDSNKPLVEKPLSFNAPILSDTLSLRSTPYAAKHRASMSLNKNEIQTQGLNGQTVSFKEYKPVDIKTIQQFTFASYTQIIRLFNIVLSDPIEPIDLISDKSTLMDSLQVMREQICKNNNLRQCLYFIYKNTVNALYSSLSSEEDVRNAIYTFKVDNRLSKSVFTSSEVLEECSTLNTTLIGLFRIYNGTFTSQVRNYITEKIETNTTSLLLNDDNSNLFDSITLKMNVILQILQSQLLDLSQYNDYIIQNKDEELKENSLNSSNKNSTNSIPTIKNVAVVQGQPRKKKLLLIKRSV